MQDKKLFLHWMLFVWLVLIGGVISVSLGWMGRVLNGDPTHITLVTLAVFVSTTLYLGRLSWKLTNGESAKIVAQKLSTGWFASSACVTLGLLGTVVGYFLMMQGVPGTGEDVAGQLVQQIRAGMGTVLINTIVGGVCGLLIEVQSHFISQTVERAVLEEEKKP